MKQKTTQPEGNFYDKYHSKSKPEQILMNNFFSKISLILNENKITPGSILEAGCGEGHVADYITGLFPDAALKGFDVSEKVISAAKKNYPKIEFTQGNIYHINEKNESYDLVIACEVLEHLEYPQEAVSELLRVSAKYLLVSVPREPLWRILNIMRGKYIPDFGNTPGHIQHWGKNGMLHFWRNRPELIVKSIKCPIPWCMFLIEKV